MDFYVILSGTIEIVQPMPGREESITVQGPASSPETWI